MRTATLIIAGAVLATAAARAQDVPPGQGANLTVHSAVPTTAATPHPAPDAPLRFAAGGLPNSGGISAGALQGPLGSPSAATSCRPAVRHVVHRHVVHHVAPPVVVASAPPPPPVYAYPVYAYRPVVVPVVPYERPYGYGYRYAAYGWRGYGGYGGWGYRGGWGDRGGWGYHRARW